MEGCLVVLMKILMKMRILTSKSHDHVLVRTGLVCRVGAGTMTWWPPLPPDRTLLDRIHPILPAPDRTWTGCALPPLPLPCEQKDRHVWKYYLPAWLVKYLTLSMMWTTDYCPRVKYIIAIKKFHGYEVFIMKSLWDPLYIHSQIWFTNVAYHIHRRFLFFKVLYMEF